MAFRSTILSENKAYWTFRAPSYSALNRAELVGTSREAWQACLRAEIARRFPGRAPETVRVLEVGTGPGFLAILLREAGYDVTAVDLTPAMLEEAKKNAGSLAGEIRFHEMNAEALDFGDHAFDVVVTRNLTWNLPHPEHAYREWHRVLKPNGLLLNFDANWYGYLFDEKALASYEEDRQNTAQRGIKDENIGDGFDVMENIARRVPLSQIKRPEWDSRLLKSIGFSVDADERIWERVWTEAEKISFSSTPLFLVSAVKAG